MGLQIRLPQILLLCLFITAIAIASCQVIHPGCQAKCGNIDIPYPFGITDDCILNQDFKLSCNETSTILRWGGLEVLSVSVDGELRILNVVGQTCYKIEGNTVVISKGTGYITLPRFPFSFNRNKFFAIGCDTAAFLSAQGQDGSFGCLSICNSKESVENGTCSGIGCCQANIPAELLSNSVNVTSFNNHLDVLSFNPCSYAFVGEEESFNFTSAYLSDFHENVSAVLDWAVGDQNCEVAKTSAADYACKGNSSCYESENGPGYRCKCSAGYQGNPYIDCQDINECEDPNNECDKQYCTNTIGNYTCSCTKGYSGDPKKGGQGCDADKSLPTNAIIIGISVGLLATIMGISWLCWMFKKRKLIKLKEKFFLDNGGLMLQQRLEGHNETAKIYTAEELEKATNKYDETRIIGRGGYGTVYKGILADGKIVAIKKSKIADKTQMEQFINEVVVLSQINHRNVVRLLGCCLETEVPLLVYEFVSNDTLFHHINNRRNTGHTVPWETRLRIATEIAGVLSYLHSSASVPIIHRDVKSTNILLDENFIAKVSDFGASKLVPLDQTELSTMVQGTLGYLDPEYLQTSQLTEKSDVYSFGVVLVELLTGKKPLSFNGPEEERCLANYFLRSLKQGRLFHVLEDCVVQQGNSEQLKEVANLAMRCLRVKGEERPTMKEVAMELEGFRVMGGHPWVVNNIGLNIEETEYLLGESSNTFGQGGGANTTVTYDSIRNHVVLSVADGR